MKRTALLAALLAAAVPASAAKRKKKPAARAEAAKKAAAQVSAAPPLIGPPLAEATLAASGVALSEDEDGLLAAAAWPDGPAAAMGLRPGDRVWRVDRAAPRTRDEAAAAIDATAPEERLSIVARRGLETLALAGAPTPAPPDFVRGARDLSAREKALAAARASRDDAAARDAVAEAAPLDWTLRADQAFWVRFPDGLPAGLARGDQVFAVAATGLTTDGALDFLAVPPKSRVWARVLSTSDDGAVRAVRLVFYKLRPAGGSAYPILGAAAALAAVPAAELARVSSGGTLVAAVPPPPPDGKKRRGGRDLILDADARLRVRLIDPVPLSEPPSWWRAGPGLWLKTAYDAAGRRRFQVTRVVAERAAAAAGLKVGDLVDAVGGRSSERMDFEEALDALYGAPGSTVKVSVILPGPRTFELTRGVRVGSKGAQTPLPLPFETR